MSLDITDPSGLLLSGSGPGPTDDMGMLVPTFDPQVFNYTLLMLPNAIDHFFLAATPSYFLTQVSFVLVAYAPSGAPLSIPAGKFTPLVAGTNSSALGLEAAWNYLYIVAVAQDGSKALTTITIQRLSVDATLANVTTTPPGQSGGLRPAFAAASGVTEYSLQFPSTQLSFIVSASLNFSFGDPRARVSWAQGPSDPLDESVYTGMTMSGSGSAGQTPTLQLVDGVQFVFLRVVAQDNTTTRTYNLSVTRASNDANLTSLAVYTLPEGTLPLQTLQPPPDPFDPAVRNYSMRVGNDCGSVQLNALTHYSLATLAYAMVFNYPSGAPAA
jgi:hypothetical protein